MRALVAWLLDEARAAGVEVQGGVRVRGYRDGALATDDGSIAADFVVDASGLSGVNLLGLPTAAREGVCVAAQEVRVVRDRAAAEAFFVSRGVDPRGAANFVGLHGGFSTLLVRLQDDTVGLLAGSLPALGHPPGRTMLERFAADHAWVGARIYGGQAPIPLAPSFAPVAGDRVAHVGDAARQVFSAHGSGVGSGLVAARLFVDAMVAGEGGRGYAQRWVREYGGLHGTYDLFRRFSATLDARDLGVLFDSGFVDRESALAGIEQRFPRLDASDLREKIGAIRRCPRLAMRLLRFVGRAPAMMGLARTYPRHELGQRRAGAAMAALVRDLPP